MKYLPSLLIYFLQERTTKRNIVLLIKFFAFLAAVIFLYSILFHAIMLYEGRHFSLITGLYWTLTVMSTLGFGDITFSTDLGMIFTIFVLLSGIVFLLIMLPFTFIQFFYAPWLEAQKKARTPRTLPEDISGHIVITNLEPITAKLIQKLAKYNYEYVIVEGDTHRALDLHEQGYRVILGDVDDPVTYERLRIHDAAMVVATNDDLMNTNISFTIREITDKVPIVTRAENVHSIDILEFPGNTRVFQFRKMLGESLGLRTFGIDVGTNVIGRFEELLIAESPAMHTPLQGRTLAEARLRERTGATVVGLWEHGIFKMPLPQTKINSTTVLVMAGTSKQLDSFDRQFAITWVDYAPDAPVLILGGGNVGCAAAEIMEARKIPYTIVEKRERLVCLDHKNHIQGDAADINILVKAGIKEARTVIVTTHDDAMNIYLAFYCRKLRPDVQIISRATSDKTVSKLHKAGADTVLSYATMGANRILNLLQPDDMSVFTEGLNVFNSTVRDSLAGRTLAETSIREKTGCSVIAVKSGDQLTVSPDPHKPLRKHDELILISTIESEKKFLENYSKPERGK
ncbi:MAG: NAD-binding protein [Desulfobulbaceae bacterium]|nr:NAD-binding protein [Desulfobulbaceae bacterium]